MVDNENLQFFRKLFVLAGISPLTTTTETNSYHKRYCKTILYSIPAIFSMIASITLFQISLFPDLNYDRILMILFNAYFLMVTMVTLVANINCLVYKRTYFNIVERINGIQNSFEFYCKMEVNYHKLVKFYRIKFCVVYLVWLEMSLVSYLIHLDDTSEMIFTTVTIVLEWSCSLACMQTILFIDHVGLFTEELNETIVSSKSYFQSSELSQIRAENLVKLKRLHFDIWNLVQQINRYFGWLFVTLFVKYLVDIIYSLYLIFINFEEFGWNTLMHLGKVFQLIFVKFNFIRIRVQFDEILETGSLKCLLVPRKNLVLEVFLILLNENGSKILNFKIENIPLSIHTLQVDFKFKKNNAFPITLPIVTVAALN